jgi:ketosteroid isomerase-like protein
MSQENVERIKEGFAAHNRGDLDAMVELYDRECMFKTLLLGTHHGNEAIRLIYEENKKNLSGYNVVPVELIDRFAFVFTLRDGHIVREQAFRNREEALETMGLSEQDAPADS